MEAIVQGGKTIISADDTTIIAMMVEALRSGRSATFYVTPDQAQAVMRLYWTPGRIRAVGMERVSQEERDKIQSELGIKDMGTGFSNRAQCSCGGVYGMFEFMEQGLRQHGREWVGAVVELKDTAVLRINPVQDIFCPKCRLIIITSHWYSMYTDGGKMLYGCCKSDSIESGTILALA
jgi:hypothetical protein